MKKKLTTVLSVAGTYAYLTDKTGPVVNTFTVGKVKIALAETTGPEYQLIPGKEYTKDPVVTVKGGSEKCYLFVKFDEIGNPADYLTYTSLLAAPAWTQGDGTKIPKDVWYRVVNKSATDTTFNLLAGDKVTIKDDVTNENMTAASGAKLAYTAYACQFEGMNAEQAWAEVKNA